VVSFGGLVLGKEEGKRIAKALGTTNKSVILENHGYREKIHFSLMCRLLTVGQTVDEAAFRHMIMERTCQAQLLAEAAAANGIKKNIITDADAQYTADALTEPVSHFKYSADLQESLYFDFQVEYNLLLEETGGTFLR
jgi:ribulose-5-phosphate 4-epimerase/fuculose-1-phosphate aldolase